ncbi:MAG: DDE transposase family protein [Bacteroidota bacterium]|jgi:transposase|nr:DDE transposase family protein [Bacteroidota bacterium]HHU96839.1 DDE transposase family protein [Petrimonas sp.]
MAKLTNAQKKEWAQLLYTRENLPQKEIARRVDVSTATMSKWVKAGNWDKLKVSLTITREEQLNNLYRQLAEINKEIAERGENRYATPAEADTITKLANAIDKFQTETGLNDVLSVFKDFFSWLRTFDLEEAQRLLPLYDDFVKTKLR